MINRDTTVLTAHLFSAITVLTAHLFSAITVLTAHLFSAITVLTAFSPSVRCLHGTGDVWSARGRSLQRVSRAGLGPWCQLS